jgi:hypothetical protein
MIAPARIASEGGPHVAVALVHHPVLDRHGDVVTTAVTSLDIHDVARISRTWDAAPYYLVTPVTAQQDMVKRIAQHWVDGEGYKQDHPRVSAMSQIRVVESLEAAAADLQAVHGVRPKVVVTGARLQGDVASFADLRGRMASGEAPSWLLVFGTGWGLTPAVVEAADVRLEPIAGRAGFNHLPVRAAIAIVLDRLLGPALY